MNRLTKGDTYRSSFRDRLCARANHTVIAAVKRGLLPQVETLLCVDCGVPAECWDHRDYRYPMLVQAVCKGCNNRRGPGLPEIAQEDRSYFRRDPSAPKYTALHYLTMREGISGTYMPEEFPVRAHLFWKDLEEREALEQDIRSNTYALTKFRRPAGRGCWFGWSRDDFFKTHDPWALT